MKNDTTIVRMRSCDHLGDAKNDEKKAPRSVEFKFFINPFACELSMWKKCTFDKFLFTGRNYMFWKSVLHTFEQREAQWPIGYGVGLQIERSSVRIRLWPLHWVLGQGSLLPVSQGEAFTLASISYLAILVKYILAKKKKKKTKLINFEEWNVDQIVVQSLVFARTLLRRPWKTLQELVPLRRAWKVGFPFRFTISLEMGIKFSQWNRFSWFIGRFS